MSWAKGLLPCCTAADCTCFDCVAQCCRLMKRKPQVNDVVFWIMDVESIGCRPRRDELASSAGWAAASRGCCATIGRQLHKGWPKCRRSLRAAEGLPVLEHQLQRGEALEFVPLGTVDRSKPCR